MKKFYFIFFLASVFILQNSLAQDITHLAAGSTWKYSTGASLGTTWTAISYNDAAWSSGAAQLGYGDADEATVIPSGSSPNFYPTYYFRKTITATPSSLADLKLRVKRDDGVVVYINGIEVYRDNMPAGTPAYTTYASAACSDDGATWLTSTLSVGSLIEGTNVVAVEIHQSSGSSSDVSFDFELKSQPKSIVVEGGVWKYSTGTDLGAGWISSVYNDAAWSSGAAELGYGDADEATVIPSGTSPNFYPTYYFRKSFSVTDATAFAGYTLKVKRDDGVIVYINGTEVFRNNMPAGSPTYNTWASTACSDDGATWFTATVSSSVIVSGTNVIAVEVHQSSGSSSDVTFNLDLSGVPELILSQGLNWKYSTGSDLGTTWNATGFNDASWSAGPSELGYGDGDEATVIPSGTSPNFYPTYYFRNSFTIDDPSLFGSFTLRVRRDDGIVVYLNGSEVYRDNMPAGTPAYTAWASSAASDDGDTWLSTSLTSSSFVAGANVIAVEVHQSSGSSSDVTFTLDLTGETGLASLTRGPYLQLATPTGMTVRWRTDAATNSKVAYGLTSSSLTLSATDNTSTTEHIIQLSGLTANTKYYYSVGSTTETLQGDADNYFITPPVAGTEEVIRVWATGDCGTAQTVQTNVRNAYESFIGTNYTDVWLLLGDNAYNSGYDNEYQSGFFEPYMAGKVMRQTALFPAPGNHDYYNTADLNSRTTPYFQNFTLPTAAEAGGVASGTESYYSYNYGNIHFISLDSYGTEAGNKMYDTTGAQAVWLKQDLAANTQKWTIVYWHHPPYTKGSHNSDTESDLVSVRNNMVRILDRYKVDLVLCGHSHLYERSKIMKAHYGLETTFSSATHNASSSSALYDASSNSCPYIKSSTATSNEGIVYVVAGSAGKLSGTTSGYPHNAMYYSNNTIGGSLYLEVNGNRLDAKFISDTGSILDKFTMLKDVNKKTDTTINSGQTITLKASWSGSYLWNPTSATAQSISPAPVAAITYYVDDGSYNCIHDTFNVKIKINISGAVSNTICSGTSNGSINITPSGGTTPYTYKWSNGALVEDVSGLAAGSYNVTVTDVYLSSATAVFIVGTTTPVPVVGPPVVISGPASACPGDTATYFVLPITNATSYNWAVPANATLVSGQGTYSVRVFFGSSFTSGNVSMYPSYCTLNASTKTYWVSRGSIPSMPTSISGSPIVCIGDIKTYNSATVSNATSYVWTPPANATVVSGQGTATASVQFNAGFVAGKVSVYAKNCAGNSAAQTFSVLVTPAAPEITLGPTNNICGNDTQTYAITAVVGVSSYNWVVTGATIVSGQGTESIRVAFAPGYTFANIKVQLVTPCVVSSFSKNISVFPAPATPGIISGPVTEVCGGTSQFYSISSVSGASGYSWIATGATITSGQGTTNVVVSFPLGYTSATIKVQALGTCANSAFNSAVTIRPISPLSAIKGVFYGYCGGATIVKFSLARITGTASYTWSVPANITLVSGQGTDSIVVNISSAFISGNISVYATNSCGTGSPISSTVKAIPGSPGPISGSSSVCVSASVVYNIAVVAGATSYGWTVPAGWTIQSGQGTTSITVLSGTVGGTVKVAATNACGTSSYVQKYVGMSACKAEKEEIGEANLIADRNVTAFNIFPNPASDYIIVSFSFAKSGETHFDLFDLKGKLVANIFNGYVEAGVVYQKSFITSNLSDGVYIVRATCNGSFMNRKLIIAN